MSEATKITSSLSIHKLSYLNSNVCTLLSISQSLCPLPLNYTTTPFPVEYLLDLGPRIS